MRVLVVDDSAVSRKLVQFALASQPYQVSFAKDAEEALSLFPPGTPDVVITDCEMPGMSGQDLCRKIRSMENGAKTHVIMLSSNAGEAEIAAARESGIDDYLVKPLDPAELLVKLEALRDATVEAFTPDKIRCRGTC